MWHTSGLPVSMARRVSPGRDHPLSVLHLSRIRRSVLHMTWKERIALVALAPIAATIGLIIGIALAPNPTNPAPVCHVQLLGNGNTQQQIDDLLAKGWYSKTDDNREALYSPECS